MRFQKQVVIITGAGSGIGEVSAQHFAAEGAYVVLADWQKEQAIRAAERINMQFSSEDGLPCALAVHADVADETMVAALMEQTVRTYGRVDVLFNNAAVILPAAIEQIDTPGFDRLFDVNVKGVFLMIKHAINHLRQTKGAIVNMASLAGLIGQQNNPVYSASKGAVIAMTKSLALDLAPEGVRINCVCPAGVRTPLLETWIQQQIDPARTIEELRRMHPIGRAAEPSEVAEAVLFLADRRASFITGVALPVEGGASLGY